MNHIQKAWLKILSPITPFVNEKLAKKGGILGKIGRFYAIGPRQFGYHPTNKYLALINRVYLQNIALSLHRYSFIKHLNENGYISQRPGAILSLTGMVIIFSMMFWLAIPGEFQTEEGTSLEILKDSKIPAHYSSLNDRVSAHYSEINSLYQYEMLKRIDEKIREVERARSGLSDKTKKTKYSRKGYNYIEAHTKTQ